MDISAIAGVAGAFFVVLLTLIIEGGHIFSFFQLSALVLILGGSVAVAITSFGIKTVATLPLMMGQVFMPKSVNFEAIIDEIIQIAETARHEGLLSLEDKVPEMKNKLLRSGLELVIDGTDPEIVKQILEQSSDSELEKDKETAELFETLGGFSPTLGIIGTVMGLVHVLEALGSGGMEQLGQGIAVAFIATFYGISFANLIWLPLANKAKHIAADHVLSREMVISGIISIQNGDNPRIVKQRMVSHIPDIALRDKIMSKEMAGG